MNISRQTLGQYLKTNLNLFLSVPSLRADGSHPDVPNYTSPLDKNSLNNPRMEHNVSQQDKSFSRQFDIAHALCTLIARCFYTVI